jgi:hypothetical protein
MQRKYDSCERDPLHAEAICSRLKCDRQPQRKLGVATLHSSSHQGRHSSGRDQDPAAGPSAGQSALMAVSVNLVGRHSEQSGASARELSVNVGVECRSSFCAAATLTFECSSSVSKTCRVV